MTMTLEQFLKLPGAVLTPGDGTLGINISVQLAERLECFSRSGWTKIRSNEEAKAVEDLLIFGPNTKYHAISDYGSDIIAVRPLPPTEGLCNEICPGAELQSTCIIRDEILPEPGPDAVAVFMAGIMADHKVPRAPKQLFVVAPMTRIGWMPWSDDGE